MVAFPLVTLTYWNKIIVLLIKKPCVSKYPLPELYIFLLCIDIGNSVEITPRIPDNPTNPSCTVLKYGNVAI